jgi:hypothetical protein
VALAADKRELQAALEDAVIVIDADELERSRRDPRVRAFHASSDELMSELEAEGADFS